MCLGKYDEGYKFIEAEKQLFLCAYVKQLGVSCDDICYKSSLSVTSKVQNNMDLGSFPPFLAQKVSQ